MVFNIIVLQVDVKFQVLVMTKTLLEAAQTLWAVFFFLSDIMSIPCFFVFGFDISIELHLKRSCQKGSKTGVTLLHWKINARTMINYYKILQVGGQYPMATSRSTGAYDVTQSIATVHVA